MQAGPVERPTPGPPLRSVKVAQRRIPMVIGGAGERRTFRAEARHADEWNVSPRVGSEAVGPAEFARRSAILDAHCAAVGHQPAEIRRSLQLLLRPEDAEIQAALELLDEHERAGAQHVVFGFTETPARRLLKMLRPA